MCKDKLGLFIGQDYIPDDPAQFVGSAKGNRSLAGGWEENRHTLNRQLHVSPSHLLTVCTSPASTLSMQRCGTSSSSFQQTLCHTMSERVQVDSRGAISLNTRAAEKITKTIYQSI